MIFGSDLEIQKPLKFKNLDTFEAPWWELFNGKALECGFGAISKPPGAKFKVF